MGVKHVITSAECVEAGVTSFRLVEAVLRALANAGDEIFASQALARQGVALGYAAARGRPSSLGFLKSGYSLASISDRQNGRRGRGHRCAQ